MNKPRTWLIASGVGLAAALTAGLVVAQDPPRDGPPATVTPAPAATVPTPQPTGPAVEEAPPAPEVVAQVAPVAASAPAPSPPPSSDDDESKIRDAGKAPALADVQHRPRHPVAVLQALDKITAETIRFEARVGRPTRYRGLIITVRACETTTPDEPMRDVAAYMEIQSQPRGVAASRQVFHGWMYAQNPALNALKHPVYDAWVVACKD